MVRRKNEGSFGCEAVARALGQPNVPECGWGFLYFLSLCSKNSFMFLSVVWSFYNERQRSYAMYLLPISCSAFCQPKQLLQAHYTLQI